MRKRDAELFKNSLIEIMASRPDVLDSVTEYFKNRDQTRREAVKDIGKFSYDTYLEAIEFMRKNADIKDFVVDFVKLIDKFDFIADTTDFLIRQALKEGKTKTVIEILDAYFKDAIFLKYKR